MKPKICEVYEYFELTKLKVYIKKSIFTEYGERGFCFLLKKVMILTYINIFLWILNSS